MPNANPVEGAPNELEAQGSLLATLQSAATADGNGSVASLDGFAGATLLELQKTGTGTTTVVVEGSLDGATWYAAGYQLIDATAAPARAVAAISLGAGTVNHVYSVLDYYPYLRARMASTAGAVSVLARVYATPVT